MGSCAAMALLAIPPGESRPLCIDLRDGTTRELIEAKGTASCDNLASRWGQLLDYGRFADAQWGMPNYCGTC
jgi:hypothetical protein